MTAPVKTDCSVEGCEKSSRGRRYCTGHYARVKKYGNPQAEKPLRSPRSKSEISPTPTTSQCSKCLTVKSNDDFYNRIAGDTERKHYWCKKCVCAHVDAIHKRNRENGKPRKRPPRHVIRAHRLRYKYGISAGEYDALLAAQGGGCAICGDEPPPPLEQRNLQVDHDHATGAIRGILCGPCNRGLAGFRDNPEWMQRAAAYIENVYAEVAA